MGAEVVPMKLAAKMPAKFADVVEREPPASIDTILAIADRVAREPDATVLVLGETGVGKSWLARRIHRASPRADQVFLEINCASLAPELVESELFGHERGAFTGANEPKRGLVEAANGGTLFLDEIGDLPLPAQAHLLSFFDTHRFRRVGGTRPLSSDVRVLAATNIDLEKAIAAGRFRKDLYFRLSVFPLRIPPLRERRADLPGLAREVLSELCSMRGMGGDVELSEGMLRALASYDWPGNIRELRNVLERVLVLNREGSRPIEILPFGLERSALEERRANVRTLDEAVRAHIEVVLAGVGGNRSRAARILGISRSTLRRKLGERD